MAFRFKNSLWIVDVDFDDDFNSQKSTFNYLFYMRRCSCMLDVDIAKMCGAVRYKKFIIPKVEKKMV